MVVPLTDGILNVKALQVFFPGATGLTYSKNDDQAVNFVEDDKMKIDPDVDYYDVYFPGEYNLEVPYMYASYRYVYKIT